jgi:hypothetical protein
MIKLKSLIKEVKQYGFDLTDFKVNGFKKVLQGLKIRPKAELSDKSGGSWHWKGNGILIVTANNPITGEYASSGTAGGVKRKKEKNYASYIGVQGHPDKVEKAVELIKKHASYIKAEDPKRRSYI